MQSTGTARAAPASRSQGSGVRMVRKWHRRGARHGRKAQLERVSRACASVMAELEQAWAERAGLPRASDLAPDWTCSEFCGPWVLGFNNTVPAGVQRTADPENAPFLDLYLWAKLRALDQEAHRLGGCAVRGAKLVGVVKSGQVQRMAPIPVLARAGVREFEQLPLFRLA